jgi:putative transposase
VTVTGAVADDGTAALQVLAELAPESYPRPKEPWADNRYRNHAPDGWMSEHGWYAIEVTSRPPKSPEFRVIKWRWVVERTFAWLGRCRIHSRDYERKTESSEAQVQISMIQLMLRRLAGERDQSPFRYPRPAYKTAA